MSWTMIIMLAGGSYTSSGYTALTTVPGFVSAKTCAEAGDRVIKNKITYELRVICVEVQK